MGFESLAMFATIWHVKVSVSRTENVKHTTLFFLSFFNHHFRLFCKLI